MTQTITSDSITSVSVNNILISNSTVSRPAFSWCSKCGQSMEISTESNLYKSKNNFKFRKIFDFEDSEVVVKTFSCALVDEILLQGTLYASQNFFCFFSRIANKQKKVIISVEKIIEITKEKTAGIFPNAIAIRTEHNRHLFSSFVHREIAFRCLNEVWANRQDERLTPNWNLAFSEGTDSKENQLSDIDVETESLIIETPIISKLLSNEDDEENEESDPDDDIIRTITAANKIPNFYEQNGNKNVIQGRFGIDKNSCLSISVFLKTVLQFISKEKIQLISAILILVVLTVYVLILAWKIHNFQMILVDRLSLSCSSLKTNSKITGCSSYDKSNKIHEGSTIQMSKVLLNLNDTLNLLQSVAEISGKMSTKQRRISLDKIIDEVIRNMTIFH